MATEVDYDLLILDGMLPGIDGLAVLAALRQSKQTPVLMLTARGQVEDRVRGLQSGADDYLVKPFAFSELVARIQVLLRRAGSVKSHGEPTLLKLADLELDLIRRKVTRAGQRLDLTAKEFNLLSLLLRRQAEVLSRTELAEQVWDMNFDSETNVVEVAVRRLRSKLDQPFERPLLHTVRGMGYVLEAREPVSGLQRPPACAGGCRSGLHADHAGPGALVCAAVYVVIAVTLSQRQDETLTQKQVAVEHLLTEGRGAHDLAGVRHLLKDFLAGDDELSLRLVNGDGQVIFETSTRQPPLADSKRRVFDIRLPPDAGSGPRRAGAGQARRRGLAGRLAWTLALAALTGALAAVGDFMLVRLGWPPCTSSRANRRVTATDLERRLDGGRTGRQLQPLIG